MTDTELSRREFLVRADAAAKTSLIALSLPAIMSISAEARAAHAAHAAGAPSGAFVALGEEEAREFAAIAARIIPSDETPGATEAGAIHFMDRVLGDSHADMLPAMREGLADLQARADGTFGESSFAALSPEQQDELLRAIEDGAFFATMRFLTIAGTFSLPEYGGNRDLVGWELIGFENRHVWTSPYGFYDADYAAKGA